LADSGSPRKRRWRRLVWYALLIIFLGAGAAFLYRRYHGRDKRDCLLGQMFLERGNTSQALLRFKEALKLNPKLTDARVGLVQTLVRREEFSEALDEVNHAIENGFPESDAALLKAKVFGARAAYRFGAAGRQYTLKTCEQAIAEDVDPAIALVQPLMEKVEKPAGALTVLGELYAQKSRIERWQQGLLVKAYKQAQDLDNKDEMAAREQDIRTVLLKIRSSQRLSDQAYEEAIKKDPKAPDPRLALAREALAAYNPRTDQAKTFLDPLMSLTPPPRDAVYLMALAEWYSGNLDRALEDMRLLNRQGQPRPEYLATEAEILIAGGRWPEARAAAEKLGKLGQKQPEFRWVMGRVLLHEGHADEALDYLSSLFTGSASSAVARLALAQAMMMTKPPKREQAISQYTKVLEDSAGVTPRNIRTENELRDASYQACVALAGASKEIGPKAAQAYAVRALGLAPERPEAFQLAHDVCKEAGVAPERIENIVLFHARAMARDPAQARAVDEFLQKEYEEFKDTLGKGVRILLMRASLLERNGSYLDAAAVYDKVRKEFPKAAVAAYALARLDVRLGHYPEAREVYESVLAADPNDARAAIGLVGVLLRLKDTKAANAVLDRVAATSNSAQVWARMLSIFIDEKRLDEAVSLAKSHAEKNPANATAQCMLAEVLWAQGDLKGAREAFDETLRLAPDFVLAVRGALLDVEQDHAPDAVPLLRATAGRLHTNSAKADLAVALQAEGKSEEAAGLLKEIATSVQGPALPLDVPRWYLAVLLAGEGDLKGAAAMSDLLAAREFVTLPADRLELLKRVVAKAEPERRALAAKLNVVLWLSMNSCPGVLEQADLLAKLLPDEPLAATWQAQLLNKAGKPEEAAQKCRDILSAHPAFVTARLLLAEIQRQNGQVAEAIQALDEALNTVPPELVGGVQLRRARLLDEADRLEEAIAAYETITGPPMLTATASNELAWLYVTKLNDPDSALPIAEQAAKLSPNDPAILDTLGWVLYLKGDTDRALELLQKAKRGLPGNPTLRYHLGLLYLKIGRKDDAKEELDEALGISRDFPEAADAAAQLAGI
jgi:tetratricopeptide (TPR) repeat protein